MSNQQTEFADFFEASWEPNGPPAGYGESDSLGLLYGGPGPSGP